jgi:hypothetical protein
VVPQAANDTHFVIQRRGCVDRQCTPQRCILRIPKGFWHDSDNPVRLPVDAHHTVDD